MSAKIYQGTVGLVIDVPIVGVESITGCQNPKFYVMPPGAEGEEEWAVTVEYEEQMFRHVVPEDKPLAHGRYRIQPYFELGAFKGRWGTVSLLVHKSFN